MHGLVDSRNKSRREEERIKAEKAPRPTLSDSCALRSSLSLSLAFRHSVSRRPNKPLMRNGCYSCPPRYFCAITIYHICLSTVHPHASLPLLSPPLPLYFYASRRRRREPVAAIDTKSGVSYPASRIHFSVVRESSFQMARLIYHERYASRTFFFGGSFRCDRIRSSCNRIAYCSLLKTTPTRNS